MQQRYYDPVAMRFLSVDPVAASPLSFNRYWYAANNPYKNIDPDGRYESPALLRSTVPGQVSFDNAMTSIENGNYGQAAMYAGAMVAEQMLSVATLGVGGSASITAKAIGSAEAAGGRVAAGATEQTSNLANRASQIHEILDPIAKNQRTTAVLQTDAGNIIAGGARDLTPAQRALMGAGEVAAKQAGAHAEITALNAAQRLGASPQAMAVTRAICTQCAAAIESAGGKLTSPTTAVWPK
jgi:uncharacterized protein RhaS with RHS repeats